MLPVVKGVDFTMKQILIYIIVLVAVTLSLYWVYSSWIYLAVAIVAGYIFLKKSYNAKQDQSIKQLRGLFGYSILYLFALFFAIIIESSLDYWVF